MGSFIGWATDRLVRRNIIERERRRTAKECKLTWTIDPLAQGVAKLRIEAETQEEITPRVLSKSRFDKGISSTYSYAHSPPRTSITPLFFLRGARHESSVSHLSCSCRVVSTCLPSHGLDKSRRDSFDILPAESDAVRRCDGKRYIPAGL